MLSGELRVAKVGVRGMQLGRVRVSAAEGGGVLGHGVGASSCILRGFLLTLLLVLLGVNAFVLFEILWTLEGLAAGIAVVRLERGVHANV